MTPDTASQTALIVLTVAVSIQTIVMIALAVIVLRTRRQVQEEFDRISPWRFSTALLKCTRQRMTRHERCLCSARWAR